MIKKNVYILFPAGYHGNYVKWAIEVSDSDSRKNTTLNPINKQISEKFGGVGTSHMNVRIPTHQKFNLHQRWMILNKPTEPNVYVIYSASMEGRTGAVEESITDLLFEDRTGIVILVHDNDDNDTRGYGRINCVTKWPTNIDTTFNSGAQLNLAIKDTVNAFLDKNFKAIDSAQNREFRNFLVKNPSIIGTQQKIDFEILSENIQASKNWYRARNSAQPHEINQDTYIADVDHLNKRIFEIDCKDIASNRFLDIFNKIMQESDISDNWSMDFVNAVHQEYLDAQPNLQWFKSIQHWENTGQLDRYLTSHAVIEAEVISRILKKSNVVEYTERDRIRWLLFYTNVQGPDWPSVPNSELEFYNLPAWVQSEILNDFGYCLKTPERPLRAIAEMKWETMTIEDINNAYQQARKKQ